MGRQEELDDRLAEQLLRGRTDVSTPDDQLLVDVLAELRHAATGTGPRPGPELQRIFADGVTEQTQHTGAPATLPRTRAAAGHRWRPARLTVRATGLGLVIKLALGAAVAAAAVSGVGLSDAPSGRLGDAEPIPEPDPALDLEVLEDLPSGRFAPPPAPGPAPRSIEPDAERRPGPSPWAPGRPMELDVPSGPPEGPGRDATDEAAGGAPRGRPPVAGDPPAGGEAPPERTPARPSERTPGPPAATPDPPGAPGGTPSGPDDAGGQPGAAAEPAPPTAGAPPTPDREADDDHGGPGFATSGAEPQGPAGRGGPPGPSVPAGPVTP